MRIDDLVEALDRDVVSLTAHAHALSDLVGGDKNIPRVFTCSSDPETEAVKALVLPSLPALPVLARLGTDAATANVAAAPRRAAPFL